MSYYAHTKDPEVAKKKLVEHNALVQAIEMGTPQDDVIKKFGFKSVAALKAAYLDGLAALGKVAEVNTKRKEKPVDNKVKINSRGSLVIPKALVEALGLSNSDVFVVRKDGNGLSMKPAKKSPKTMLRKKS